MTDIGEIKLKMAKKLQEATDLRMELSSRTEIDVARLAALDKSIQGIISSLKTVNETIKEPAISADPTISMAKNIPYRSEQYRKTKGVKPTTIRIDEDTARRINQLKELYKIPYADVITMLVNMYDDMITNQTAAG